MVVEEAHTPLWRRYATVGAYIGAVVGFLVAAFAIPLLEMAGLSFEGAVLWLAVVDLPASIVLGQFGVIANGLVLGTVVGAFYGYRRQSKAAISAIL